MAYPAEMRALAIIVTHFFWSKLDFCVFALPYFVRFDDPLIHLEAVRDIDAVASPGQPVGLSSE